MKNWEVEAILKFYKDIDLDKVTAVNTKGTHPYHCISQDGKGVYGWVNAADVK